VPATILVDTPAREISGSENVRDAVVKTSVGKTRVKIFRVVAQVRRNIKVLANVERWQAKRTHGSVDTHFNTCLLWRGVLSFHPRRT